MKKQSFITILLTMLMSMAGAKTFAHDIAVANADGTTIYYKWANNKTELSVSYQGSYVSYYSNEYSGNVVIPKSVVYDGNTYSVTSIGGSAFYNCSGLTSVTIPNSVTSIGSSAFYGCNGLTSITIPNSVTSIGESAFSGCSGLTSITIPNSVTSIGSYAFYGTAWYNNQPEGMVYAGKVAYGYKGNMPANTIITIKDGTLGIAGNAFYGYSNLASVVLPNSVQTINGNAFRECSGLTSFIIPQNVTSIGSDVFRDCNSLTTIISEITSPFNIGDVFYNNYSYKTLIVPKDTKSAYQAAEGWKKFTNIVEAGEGGIVGKTFNADGLNYTIGENNTVSLVSCSDKSAYSLVIPSKVSFNGITYSVTSIGESAFYNCSNMLSIVIPNSVTSIGRYAFENCSNLTSIVIGSGVKSIGYDAFESTNRKKTIWLTNTPPSGYSYAAGTVNYVSNDQFSFSNQVKYQFLSSYFDVDGIRYVPVSPSEKTCDAIDCVYDESAANTKMASTVSYKGVTMNVKDIKPYLAYNNKYIKGLAIDIDGELPNYAFTNCSNMQSVSLGQNISAIGSSAFLNCSALEAIRIPDKVTMLNDYAFGGCKSLKEIKIGSQTKTINQYAFSGCSSLQSITIPKAVTNIYNYAFNGCTSINKVTIADSQSTLTLGSNGSNPIFSSCPLDYVYIGRDISYSTSSSSGYSPFYRNTTLREVKITDKETEISENEFYGCSNLQSVTIGDGVTTIGNWAFSGCQSLKYFAFGSQLANIGQEAFSDCAAVVEISSKAKTAPVCGSQALDDINKWDCKLYVPDGCMAAYKNADQWKDFFFKEEGEGTAEQNPEGQPETGKCKTPKITIVDGKIHFSCATKGVKYTYNITSSAPSGVGNNIIPSSLIITVYASKPGYEDSDVASKEIDINTGIRGDLNNDSSVNVADHVELSKIILNQNK